MVAIAMIGDLEVCPHCRRSFRVRISEDIGFYAHWDGDYYLFDVVLLVPEDSIVHGLCRVYLGTVLYREVYVLS